MKIAPLFLLKLDSSAKIVGLDVPEKYLHIQQKLLSLGFVSGREVLMVQKSYGLMKVRVGQDSDVGLDKFVASMVKIEPKNADSLLTEHVGVGLFSTLVKKIFGKNQKG